MERFKVHGIEAIKGSGLIATHETDLPIVAELISQLPLCGLISGSDTDLVCGSIPVPFRKGKWIIDTNFVNNDMDVWRDGPPFEIGKIPDLEILKKNCELYANADSLYGKVGVWFYTAEKVLSLSWASQTQEWLDLLNLKEFPDSIACTWADSRSLADDGYGWTKFIPSNLSMFVIFTQSDLVSSCRILEFVMNTHLTSGTFLLLVMPDTGKAIAIKPTDYKINPEGVEADVLVVPRTRRSTCYPEYHFLPKGILKKDIDAMAALRLDPSEEKLSWDEKNNLNLLGMMRTDSELKARLTTGSWDHYANSRFNSISWRDIDKARLDLMAVNLMINESSKVLENPIDRRNLIYKKMELLNIADGEPLGKAIELIESYNKSLIAEKS